MSSNQQNGVGGGCGDQIKKFKQQKSMKKANPDGLNKAPIQSSHLGLSQTQQRKQSSSKVTNELPNYKKPTSRFDVSKNKLQVSTDFLISSSKMRTMNNSENSVSSPDHPGSKAVAKDQVRNSGLKPVRSSMKKNSGVGLHSTVNLSRATSSSTVKIDRKPESLDLDETDGISNQKLCSYKYCSLHGQKKNEASLPPLKCFLSARRQSVKLPNSMKQKEQSSTRKNGRKEIYSKPQEGTLQQQSFEDSSQYEAEIVDIVNGINGMIMEDSYETNQLQESYSVTSFEDYADNNSEISIEELKVFDEGIQYTEAERQEEARLESEKGKTGHVNWEEAAGLYLQSQSNSSQCFDDFFGQTQDNILVNSVDGINFTPSKENTPSTCQHAGAETKLSPEADSKLSPEADDVKVDREIQQSTTFSYDNEEESEESANGSLQSGIEVPNSPKELLEADWDNLKVNCGEEHVMKARVENVGSCEPSKHETNNESQQGIRSNNDKDRNIISDGLINEKEKIKYSASFISENPLAELTNRPKPIYSTTRKITAENQENARAFNPRPLRFLPLKPEPEAEVVNLKHQTVDERKTAEEWMIDYALQKTLKRMAPARKRKVALLIAAFESVIQQEQ
ncbi:hypothetical protein IEQ34_009078 [Dendrobium chrysotoxum]|uniref:Calmodulin-binding domain-containing protein n=1 Tax=Dendrobium chrysotoxum TaxID=161865 RepID=A0AAV7H0L9_DENCH|nr:hypothetical protein IEQ34_009078 [Dendrobium chrysotoxum]